MNITLREYLEMHELKTTYDHLSIMKNGEEIGSMCGAFCNGAIGYVDDPILDMNIENICINHNYPWDGVNELIIEVDGSALFRFYDLELADRFQIIANMSENPMFRSMTLAEVMDYLERKDIMIYYGNGCEIMRTVLVEY